MFHLGHDLVCSNVDLALSHIGFTLADECACSALSLAWQLLLGREHVHVDFRRIDRGDRPTPDLRLQCRRAKKSGLSRSGACGLVLAASRPEIWIPRERL